MASNEKSISKSTPSAATIPFPLERHSSAATMTNTNPVSNIRTSSSSPTFDPLSFSPVNLSLSDGPNSNDGEYPEGGLEAWLVVIGCALLNFSTFGFVNAWVFQEFYSQTILSDQSHSNM
ncbi:uncharacterized protein EI90DRAFT_2481292 [Cantharellus anzutake]|uniref:uncharacterized protein n=1 Tax=Cantharellus anzutake TaxID=1750568 RepID=UPI001908DC1D|nr:uncharacterized protein EI90DRAFT_2481292 [Cantharellus anzutake]KAF8322342.1 hypothetical protein EI90DRAFT_2481292 [Cantharellus anzutake]